MTPYPPLILTTATFAQVVQLHPWKKMPLPEMVVQKVPSERQMWPQTSVLVLEWQAKYANTAPDNLH